MLRRGVRPRDGVGEPAPGDLGLACFDLGDFAFSSGSFAVAVPELRCRSGSSGSSEDLFVGVDLDHATLDSFRASVMQRTRGADRRREPDLGPFPISPVGMVTVWPAGQVIVAASRSIAKSALLNNPFGDDAGGAGATRSIPGPAECLAGLDRSVVGVRDHLGHRDRIVVEQRVEHRRVMGGGGRGGD